MIGIAVKMLLSMHAYSVARLLIISKRIQSEIKELFFSPTARLLS